MTQQELLHLARLGAEARLAELQREMSAIFQTFPDLRAGGSSQAPASRGGGNGAAKETAVRPRRARPSMSREARQRIAEAQRKRWAEWREKQSKAGDGTTALDAAPENPRKQTGRRKVR